MSFYKEYLSKKGKSKIKKSEGKRNEKKVIEAPREDPIEELVSHSENKEEIEREKFLRRIYGSPKEDSLIDETSSLLVTDTASKAPITPVLTKGQKIWTRIVVGLLIVIILGFLTGIFWRWTIQNPRIITKEDIREVEKIVTIPEILAPRSIFQYEEFLEPIITQSSELTAYIKQYLRKNYPEEQLIKVSFKNQVDELKPRFITLSDLFSILKISSPSGVLDSAIKEDLNVFIYSGSKNDIGFAFSVEPDELVQFQGITLGTWDNTMQKDLIPLFSLVEKSEILSPSASTHMGANIRCKGEETTFFCYTIFKNHFIAASSLESVQIAINKFLTN